MKSLIIYLFLISTSLPVFSQECIGPKTAKIGMVFLHGMDSPEFGPQERKTREHFTKMAKELDIAFALPRSPMKCPTKPHLVCWGWSFQELNSVDNALAASEKAKQTCFPEAKSTGIMGYSNGGYVVNYILKYCKKNSFNWAISIGAGSTWKDSDAVTDMSSCGQYVFLTGIQDTYNYDTVLKMKPWLQKRKVNFSIAEYDGGHTVPYNELLAEVKKLTAGKAKK